MNRILVLLFITFFLGGGMFIKGQSSKCLEAQGPAIKKNHEVKGFDELILKMKANVVITQQDNPRVTIKAQRQLHSHINTKVLNRKLVLKLDTSICSQKKIRIQVSAPNVQNIKNNSSGKIESSNTFEQDNIQFKVNGSGKINFRVRAKKIYSKINGSGIIEISGKVDNHVIKTQGSGSVNTFYLTSKKADIHALGSSNIGLYASNKLKVKIKGSARIRYKGTPKLNAKIHGRGKIIAVQ